MKQVKNARVISCDYNSTSFSTRVCLGLLETSDADFLYHLINDREVQQWLGTQFPLTLGNEITWLEKINFQEMRQHIFGVFLKNMNDEDTFTSHQLIGTMGLSGINLFDRRAESGSNIHPNFQSKGYGFEAKMLLLDYAFNRLNLRKVTSSAHIHNERSIRHNQKAGYQIVGVQKEHRYVNGKYHDTSILECFKTDWEPIWENFTSGRF